MKNPFYTTLKAQKEERDKFIDFYQSGLLVGSQAQNSEATKKEAAIEAASPRTMKSSSNEDIPAAIESDKTTQAKVGEIDAGDLFMHTRVDIAEDEPVSKAKY